MKKRAWEIEYDTIRSSKPPESQEEDRSWELMEQLERFQDGQVRLWWHSNVPGSGAPEHLSVAAVQALENRGMKVEGWEELVDAGYKAMGSGDNAELIRIHTRLRALLRKARRNEESEYWRYVHYHNWQEYLRDVDFAGAANTADAAQVDTGSEEFRDRIYAGWLAQILAGAHGTALEGYTTDNLREAFGEVHDYVYPPSTINDDITYELAFLKAYDRHGPKLSSADIAEWWAALIPFGWSAEWVALENLRTGIMPPESGKVNNPFYEWIGAQMRGAVCGMCAPGDPKEAARLAWLDGEISHADNGIIGEIFNALLVSLAFVYDDVRELLEAAVQLIPPKSEYRSVLETAMRQCRKHEQWEPAWRVCEQTYRHYNWVHAYPNAAAELIALWYGAGDFDTSLHIVSMEGQDVDCNAAQIMTVIGIMAGSEGIPEKWKEPIGDTLYTYVRTMKEMKISELADWTVRLVRENRKYAT